MTKAKRITKIVVLAAIALIADLAHTDYNSSGIIAIALMYLYRKDHIQRMVWGCIALSILSSISELFAFVNIPIISNYNGERGRGPKYLFYIIYPLHLLIIYLIAYKMGLRGTATLGPDILSGQVRMF